MSIRLEQFQKIRQAAEEALQEAQLSRIDFDEGVNCWDLRCARVYWWEDDSGDQGYMVEIEEADPGAIGFRQWSKKNIIEKTGIATVNVITEW